MEPYINLQGSRSSARYWYTRDEVQLASGSRHRFGRTDLLENLIAFRSEGTPLAASLDSTGAFTRVVDCVRSADEPQRIDDRFVTWEGVDGDSHPVVTEVQRWMEQAVAKQMTFAEVGAPWAMEDAIAILAADATRGGER